MRTAVAHVAGKYNYPGTAGAQFTEGCNAIWNAGFRVLKVYCTPSYSTLDYPRQTWTGVATTLKTLAQRAEYATQLARGWSRIILSTFTFANNPSGINNWWRVDPSTASMQAEYTEVRDLAEHLLSTYSNQTFVLQNWEGDWAFMDLFVADTYVERKQVDRYAAFLGTRQRAVSDARAAIASTSTVLNAIEVNRVIDSATFPHRRRILTDIAPRVRPDVASWSAYDGSIDTAIGFGADYATWAAFTLPLFARGLRQIQLAWPGIPIQVGEFGFPEGAELPTGRNVGDMVTAIGGVASAAGVTDLTYWQIFDNEDLGQFSTNYALSSNSIGDGNYVLETNTSLAVTLNNATAPDGGTTATKIDFGAVTSLQYSQVLQLIPGCVSGQVHTFTVYLRAATAMTVYMWIYDTSQNSPAQACSVTTTWQRFTVTYIGTVTGTWKFALGNNRFGLTTSADTPAQTVYAWGEQVERRATATPLIPTTSAPLSGNARGFYIIKPDGSTSQAGLAMAAL